jgi:hypothetical protein
LGKWNWQADAVTRRLGDHHVVGDKRLEHMEQVVPEPQNLLEQLRLFGYSPPALNISSFADLCH